MEEISTALVRSALTRRICGSMGRESRFSSCGGCSFVGWGLASYSLHSFESFTAPHHPTADLAEKQIGLQVAANGFLRRVLLGAAAREIREGLTGGASLATALDEPTPKVLVTFLEPWVPGIGRWELGSPLSSLKG